MAGIELSEPFLLSERGSTRATAYKMTNKAVRIGSLTHVAWLDAVAGVRLRTFDHKAQAWSDTVELGEGCDNHTNPALTAAPDGRLRIAYGPHGWWNPREGQPAFNHGRFILKETLRPNDIREWRDLPTAGYGATYASLITDARGCDHLVYRGGPQPHGAMYERRPGEVWDCIARLGHVPTQPQYTFVGANVAVGAGDTVYAAFMYYSQLHNRSAGVCVLQSEDHGSTWTGMDGYPVSLPLQYDPRFAIPHGGYRPYPGGLAISPTGELWAMTNDLASPRSITRVSVWRGDHWRTIELEGHMPQDWDIEQGNLSFDALGRLLVVVDAVPVGVRAQGKAWGHPQREVFLLASDDQGESFGVQQVSQGNGTVANWLGNLSRTGPNHDLSTPVILYTEGIPGEGCAPDTTTRVWAVVCQ